MTDTTRPVDQEQTMAPSGQPEPNATAKGPGGNTLGGRTLEEWRARIDELRLQVDLASKEARDEIRWRVETVENAYLAARSQLTGVRAVRADDDAPRPVLDKLVEELRQAYEAALAAARRQRAG